MGMWTNSNRSRMGSNVYTDQNQGGGNAKAGFPHIIGRDHWTSIYLRNTSQNLTVLKFTINPNVRQSRGVGNVLSPTPYWGMF